MKKHQSQRCGFRCGQKSHSSQDYGKRGAPNTERSQYLNPLSTYRHLGPHRHTGGTNADLQLRSLSSKTMHFSGCSVTQVGHISHETCTNPDVHTPVACSLSISCGAIYCEAIITWQKLLFTSYYLHQCNSYNINPGSNTAEETNAKCLCYRI